MLTGVEVLLALLGAWRLLRWAEPRAEAVFANLRHIRDEMTLRVLGPLQFEAVADVAARRVVAQCARNRGPATVSVGLSRAEGRALRIGADPAVDQRLTRAVRERLREDDLLVGPMTVVAVVDPNARPRRPRVTIAHGGRSSALRVGGPNSAGHPTWKMSERTDRGATPPGARPAAKATVCAKPEGGHPTDWCPVTAPEMVAAARNGGHPTVRACWLSVYIDGRKVGEVELREGSHVVGRDRGAVRITHPTVSREQCEFRVTQWDMTVRDLDSSRNHTQVAGRGPAEAPMSLHEGDIIYLSGAVWLTVDRANLDHEERAA